MIQGIDFDLKSVVLTNSSFGPEEIRQILRTVGRDYNAYSTLRDSVSELEGQSEERSPATNVRLGVCQFIMGQHGRAVGTLSAADGGALAHFYLGRSYFAMEDYDKAIEAFQSAQTAGYNRDDCQLGIIESLRCKGESKQALTMLDNMFGPVESTANYLYQRAATIASLGGNPDEVVALYERAVEADPGHAGALFGLALENDRRGNDVQALQLYQNAAAVFPSHVGALLNLGLLHEDRGEYDRATHCYQRVLDSYPNDKRARMYMKDAQASGDMYYDEEEQKKRDRMSQVLSIPVTDFELSVRSRNCLQKMGIMTLGDLCRCSEQELLASKNFGETSLIEIRDMLRSKGLELGQMANEKQAAPEVAYDTSGLSPDEQALLDRPIAELSLSVRARKCMVRLGISTIGELVRRTGDELLECKNFGVTSLNEVREKLTSYNLKLRGD
ncbi:DNA-directed RNA polymerase subunit alpha C-terminal domain-containing protein [Blastopirellula marina]|uniref:RNA polymerase subunit alpha domain protein n=1 Tax=Blastopirellula marina TaxID=124 RepID=A0A2S8G955_9BACT|nr:DNA-directed RNA polymerase subunit alpha C-terminal domain-containing protein [Blastopirellula marina]PQO40996.1 RNA polymerase subunit alpha domain protein [Blastopirellula marina]PTL45879.1 tetratricopeptide repeat protein [Blastopirellula marina]